MAYTARFEDALVFAAQMHVAQTRKGTATPYITHLLGVASIVGDHGGSEDQVIAALLHDTIEDCVKDHPDVAEQIEERFGADVRAMVEAVSDTYTHPKPPWKERKQAYLEHVLEMDGGDPALLVSVSDKLHNMTTMRRDMDVIGLELFDRFKASIEDTLWNYRALSDAFNAKTFPTPLQQQVALQLDRMLTDVEQWIEEHA